MRLLLVGAGGRTPFTFTLGALRGPRVRGNPTARNLRAPTWAWLLSAPWSAARWRGFPVLPAEAGLTFFPPVPTKPLLNAVFVFACSFCCYL